MLLIEFFYYKIHCKNCSYTLSYVYKTIFNTKKFVKLKMKEYFFIQINENTFIAHEYAQFI